MREEKKPNSQSISRRRRSPVRASGGADLQSELQAARSREDRDLAPSCHRDLRSRSQDRVVASSHLRSRSTARSRDRDLRSRCREARDRDLREMAPPGARTVDRRRLKLGLEIGAAWRSTDCSVSSPLSRARSLSLSLSFSGNALK